MNKFLLIFLVLLLAFSVLFYSLTKTDDKLQVYFLDIGQGDASLIRTPGGINILVDGGPDNKLLYRLGEVLPWWDRTIDYIIISHYHADHFVGLIEVLNKYQVKNILTTAHAPDDFLYYVWQDALAKNNLSATIVEAGDKFVIDEQTYWQVFSADTEHKDYNDNSLVFKFTYQDWDILYTGDLTSEMEPSLIDREFDLSAEILKVAHHGTRYSSSSGFLQAISPEICIIQSGEGNKFGHPHEELLARLKEIGCQIMRNDKLGNILIEH